MEIPSGNGGENNTLVVLSNNGLVLLVRHMPLMVYRLYGWHGGVMLNSELVSPAVRRAVLEQLKKGGYKLPSLQSFNVESYGNVGHVLYAGNM